MSSAVLAAPRVDIMAAAAALPPLLPTPPRSKMLPLLPTPCLIILPASFATSASNPKPGRADAVERWDAHKKPTGAAASSSRSTGGSPCRADSVKRWDAHKKPAGSATPPSPSRSSSVSSSRAASCERKEPGRKPGRADACERWDINKIKNQSNLTSPPSNERWGINKTKSPSSRTPPPSSEQLDSNKRPASRGSSAERWDINKKPRSQDDVLGYSTNKTASRDRHLIISKLQPVATMTVKTKPLFSGPAFSSSPEPGMLPMPTFLMAR
ncbi:hypothetical protein E2562_024342 [Oryza meyeriana var. granulata]|uniref:Uncharacterized protein n=1 Tax=Oryza meyeriana var. granulata TaxID=110450 RepID=A0A6G1CA46_9ORYZ|nr:hypothetical protein E2562_024342 [Oryza meyeriana var. granulata]